MSSNNLRRVFRFVWLRAKQSDAVKNDDPVAQRVRASRIRTIVGFEVSRSNGPKVLIAEDKPVIADTLAMFLSCNKYQCPAACDGWERLRKAREVMPDMIITGANNGDGPIGIDMAIQIRAEMPETRIIFFTGQASSTLLKEKAIAEENSFLTTVPFLPKSVPPQYLLRFMRSHLNPDTFRE